MRCSILTTTLVTLLALATGAQAETVYRDVAPWDEDRTRPEQGPDNGWFGFANGDDYGNDVPTVREDGRFDGNTNSNIQTTVRTAINPGLTTAADAELDGFLFWSPGVSDVFMYVNDAEVGAFETQLGRSVSSDELTTVDVDFANNSGTDVHLALEVDDSWYVTAVPYSQDPNSIPTSGDFPFTPHTYQVAGADFLTLGVDFNTMDASLTSGPVPLPSGTLTQWGLFTPQVTGNVRFDNYAINVVPEPASLALLATGGLALALWRRK